MITNKHDLEHDITADAVAAYDLELEKAQQALSDDLYEAYFDSRPSAIQEVSDELAELEGAFYERLREGYKKDAASLSRAYSKAVALACDCIAARTYSLDQIKRIRTEWRV